MAASGAREVPASTRASLEKWWATHAKGLQRVGLLKAIEEATAFLYEAEYLSKEPDDAVRKQMRAVVLESNMAGIKEFGELWFRCVKEKMVRMTLCADWILCVMQGDPVGGDSTGFNAFERALVAGAARVLPCYNQYYLDFLAAVQDEAVASKLKASPPPPSETDLYNSYTVVRLAADGSFTTVPFATHFATSLAPIIAAFRAWIKELQTVDASMAAGATDASDPWNASARASYIAFVQQYEACLSSEESPAALEAAWAELDRKWMETKMPIQLVHDIETGYGDPLRCKATPDMSLRFLDETYATQNAVIADIQQRLMKFYTERDTPLARRGLNALSNTMAGIYFIPFKTGISLQFSFSGQSIPNREDIKEQMGVKIYFDAVETAARVEINKTLVRKVFHDADTAVLDRFKPDAVEQLVWHVAAHEVGHAIYNLEGVKDCFTNPANNTMLEEPRAELTAMFTLRLLFQQGVLTREKLDESLAHFALDGLRYFDKYDSEALRPYIIFQIYAYKVYHRHGFLKKHEDGKLLVDTSPTLAVLDEFADCFLRLLGCMDRSDGPGLEKMLFEEMSPEDDFVRGVVANVQHK
eukprot:TRINITY_DN6224_c0_g2_i2.p1 TRINITY_DN6224_c0_g2~~TRINITY_DN6224_c0_g2_i2.p1  ORF type:complete len:586 (-),score=139.03 TRINITY_DN6224_c0_g2_i2:191-1948(-)